VIADLVAILLSLGALYNSHKTNQDNKKINETMRQILNEEDL
jgi:hypothetical protein